MPVRLREIFETVVRPEAVDRIRRYLRDTGSSMAFEVIDPVRDPHIVPCDRPQLVLLDVIRRASAFERLPYDQLKTLGEKIGIPAKEAAMTFHDPKGMLRLLETVQDDRTWRREGARGRVARARGRARLPVQGQGRRLCLLEGNPGPEKTASSPPARLGANPISAR